MLHSLTFDALIIYFILFSDDTSKNTGGEDEDNGK